MKKLFKLTLSLLMALTVICGGMVSKVSAATTITPTVATTDYIDQDSLTTYTMSYSKSTTPISMPGANYSTDAGNSSKNKHYAQVVELKVSKPGDVYFADINFSISNYSSGSYSGSGYAEMTIFTDSTLSTKLNGQNIIGFSTSSTVTKKCISFPNAGTYYLAFYRAYSTDKSSNQGIPVGTDKVTFKTYEYSAANETLTSGQWKVIAPTNSNYGYRYYKMTVSEPTNVVITTDSTSLSYDILNSSKDMKYDYCSLSSSNNCKNYIYLYTGTYYIRTQGSSSYSTSSGEASRIKFTKYSLSSSSFSFSSSKTTSVVSLADTDAPLMYQFKPTKDGFLRVMDVYGSPSYITLCKSDRTAISGKNYLKSGGFIYYGVKAGNTYYIKINSSSTANKYEFKLYTVTDSSGSKFDAAKTMTAGTTYKGLIYANSSTKDYYRLKLTSKKKFKITIGVYSNSSSDGFIVKVYKSNQSLISGSTMTLTGPKRVNSTITTTSAFPAGYYYVRIERKATTSSGSYTIKWNTVS